MRIIRIGIAPARPFTEIFLCYFNWPKNKQNRRAFCASSGYLPSTAMGPSGALPVVSGDA
jgi:hypothetical protein